MGTTMMWLLALLLLVALFAAVKFVLRRSRKWRRLPQFVWNYVGGVLAVCSITDYRAARAANVTMSGKVVVGDTVIFSEQESKHSSGKVMRCRDQVVPIAGDFEPSEMALDLFVPFASEGHMTLAQQDSLFGPAPDPEDFEREKRRANARHDYRLRLASWSSALSDVTGPLAIAIAASVIGVVISLLDSHSVELAKEAVVVYTTSAEGVRETRSTQGKLDQGEHLMYTEKFTREIEMIGGRVTRIEQISAHLARACVAKKIDEHDRIVCGMAPANIRLGDEMFVRAARFLVWMNVSRKEMLSPYFEPGAWLITRQEADALVATGQFKIIK